MELYKLIKVRVPDVGSVHVVHFGLYSDDALNLGVDKS